MIILTSDGLTSSKIKEAVGDSLKKVSKKAALVTTASDAREHDSNVWILTEQMREFGLEASCVDVEFQDPYILLAYDVIILMGGDPIVLLYHLKKWNGSKAIMKELAKKHVLIGISAGSMVLGQTIEFSGTVTGDPDRYPGCHQGYGFVPFSIMPHCLSYQTVYPITDQILEQEEERGYPIRRINDREAIVYNIKKKTEIYLEDPGYQPIVSERLKDKKPEVVIFDLYDTLIDIYVNEDKDSLWNQMSLFFGYQQAIYQPKELKDVYRYLVHEALEKERQKQGTYCIQIALEDIFEELYRKKGVKPTKQLILMTAQTFRACSCDYIRLYHGVKDLLASLKKQGMKLILLANGQRIFAEYEMKMFGIYEYFDKICFSSDVGIGKPEKRFFAEALKAIPPVPTRILLVSGKYEEDIRPAAELGMATCCIYKNAEPEQTPPPCDIYLGHMNYEALKTVLCE